MLLDMTFLARTLSQNQTLSMEKQQTESHKRRIYLSYLYYVPGMLFHMKLNYVLPHYMIRLA